jgi:hypothetical protein
VALALDELSRLSLRADRLADPAQLNARPALGVDELLPERQDPGRVVTDPRHVQEVGAVGATQGRAKPVDLRLGDHDERWLARRKALVDERRCPDNELVLAGVEQCLVTEGLRLRARRHQRLPAVSVS